MDWTIARACFDLLIAAALGGAIGVQRQASQKPAGFRTHVLVAVGSCLFTLVGAHFGDTRIAANVLTGIGFLGAGAIVRSGVSARGLTTAASIWSAAAIGLAIGFSGPLFYALAIAATAITLGALAFSDRALMNAFRLPRRVTLNIAYTLPEASESEIVRAIDEVGGGIEAAGSMTIEAAGATETIERAFKLELHRDRDVAAFARAMAGMPGVTHVGVDEQYHAD